MIIPRLLKRKRCLQAAVAAIALGFIGAGIADTREFDYSPYVSSAFPQNLYWGDLHVHTEHSLDANALGNRLGLDEAYRFARGEAVVSTTGVPMKLSRPLDFILVSDHAELMGLFRLLRNRDRRALASGVGERWGKYFENGDNTSLMYEVMALSPSENVSEVVREQGYTWPAKLKESVWQNATAAADRYNDPGKFTAFIGYEWTSQPRGDNLHRNVLFRDDAAKADQIIPFSSHDSQNPEDLWKFLSEYEQKTGGRVLAIPHNANSSNGLMFSDKTYDGKALNRSYAETRMRWEPVIEATQIKGDGEAHPYLSPTDEFADFETWDEGNNAVMVAKEKWMLQHEYARSALKLGLELESKLGANPYKFGMIGSSDTHTSLAAVEEDNFSGKFAVNEPGLRVGRVALAPKPKNGEAESARAGEHMPKPRPSNAFVAAGYAGVWAEENTRAALFDAIQRKETYATTGPRMAVRFFGGWDFVAGDDERADYAAVGYKKGVPMGGDLARAPSGKALKFLVVASKDPRGANLDRVQIVKGWLDGKGNAQEKVYNVALSDDREVDPETREVSPVGSSVDVKTATYTNDIGAPVLSTVWEDPDFDPKRKAFYYVRVLEIPSPRWSTYEAVKYGQDLPTDVPAEIQERAYTSPIWYTP